MLFHECVLIIVSSHVSQGTTHTQEEGHRECWMGQTPQPTGEEDVVVALV